MLVWEEKFVCKLFLALKSLLVLSWEPANRKSWCLWLASEACVGRRLTAPLVPGSRGSKAEVNINEKTNIQGLGWAGKCVSTFSWGLKSQHRGNFVNLNRLLGSVQRAEETTKGKSDRHHGGENENWITPF